MRGGGQLWGSGRRGSALLIVACAAVGACLPAWRTHGYGHLSLFDRFPQAERRSASPAAFAREDIVIGDTRRRVIFAHPPSRLTYELRLPARARLVTAIALKPDAWTHPGDGVVFRVGIADERRYDALFARHVNPFAVPGDRRWIPVEIDLRAYSGWQWSLFYRPWERTWRLVFSTDPGPPGTGNLAWDWAIWADPSIEWNW